MRARPKPEQKAEKMTPREAIAAVRFAAVEAGSRTYVGAKLFEAADVLEQALRATRSPAPPASARPAVAPTAPRRTTGYIDGRGDFHPGPL